MTDPASDAELLAPGEYLTRIGGCNDCHTPGFGESGGDMPKARWLMGSPVGWHGPWGTTYAANLRSRLQDMDEAAWIEYSNSSIRDHRCPVSSYGPSTTATALPSTS